MTLRVDIVENDPPTLRLYRHVAELSAASVREFRWAEDAVVAIASCPPDAVIIDEHLEGPMTGLDLLRAMRADPSTERVPVLIVTAGAARDAEDSALQAGADRWMPKPVCVGHLTEFLRGAEPRQPGR